MSNFLIKCHILFAVIDTLESTIPISFNNSFGFFCVYCGRFNPAYSHVLRIDCSQPYHIFCSSREAIGCIKYIKIIDYRIDIIKDCLRFTELSSLSTHNLQCKSEYVKTNMNIKEKRFCCNNTHLCNQTSSIFTFTQEYFLITLYLLIHYYKDNKNY
ncbi:hypothetical protein I4U23_028644 [Adineta vaga]|nr:hypothetical protein I4U23_028644 [Adineta vaga]